MINVRRRSHLQVKKVRVGHHSLSSYIVGVIASLENIGQHTMIVIQIPVVRINETDAACDTDEVTQNNRMQSGAQEGYENTLNNNKQRAKQSGG